MVHPDDHEIDVFQPKGPRQMLIVWQFRQTSKWIFNIQWLVIIGSDIDFIKHAFDNVNRFIGFLFLWADTKLYFALIKALHE